MVAAALQEPTGRASAHFDVGQLPDLAQAEENCPPAGMTVNRLLPAQCLRYQTRQRGYAGVFLIRWRVA